MVQIIQICKKSLLLVLTLLLSNIFLLSNKSFANNYGNYLSWNYSRQSGDIEKLKNFFATVNISNIETEMLEEFLFQSVVFDDWNKANLISSKILSNQKNNVSANFFSLVNNLINGKQIEYLPKKTYSKFLDTNFLKAIYLWTDSNYVDESLEVKNCIPLLCLHQGMNLMTKGKKKDAEKYFVKVEEQNFTSTRIKELLFLAFLKLKERQKAKKIFEEMSLRDLNLKPFNVNFFEKNEYFLNPVKTKKDGVAEILYNISSWYYQKDLFKYAIFFGKLSLKVRPNFNAMKLLVVNAYKEIGYEQLAYDTILKINERNPYFLRFIKIRSSLSNYEKKKGNLLVDLKKLTENHPNNWQLTLLLADRYRSLKKYEDSINLYTNVIKNELVKNKFSILYSRGIGYERINRWNEAEKDFKDALNINPDDPYILNYLAYSWLDRNMKIDEALNLLIKAVELEPNDGYIIDSLGWAYYLSGIFDKSVFYLEKAVSLMPNDATLNDHLGDAYWKSGRKKEAQSQWERVLIIDPKFKHKEIIKKKIKTGIK